jgi:farnesyl diphosphate synthase
LNDTDFRTRLDRTARAVEDLLDRGLSHSPVTGEIARPARLLEAMRYAMLGGGKRLRPHLTVEAARLLGREDEGVLRAAVAVECVHGYSLIHDDLPAMDDDDLRRGKPTLHRAFDEATAILAGDALLTFAFDLLVDEPTDPDPAIRAAITLVLARSSGIGGMAGGQMLDLEAEGRFATDGKPLAGSESEIMQLQAMKTGALLAVSVDIGAVLGRANADQRRALERYSRALGGAFQIADDLLDAEGEAATVGKATGKDAAKGKATLVSLMGADRARARLADLTREACDALAPFGEEAATLRRTATFVAERSS